MRFLAALLGLMLVFSGCDELLNDQNGKRVQPAPRPDQNLHNADNRPNNNRNNNGGGGNTSAALSYKGKPLKLTKHAKCRMGCRYIDESEIMEVIAQNNINQRKSKPDDKPCPSYAYEGDTREGQRCRIVIAECDNEARVVTVIDLKNDFECECE